MQDNKVRGISKTAKILTVMFAVAMFMGAGPGLRLVNPDPADTEAVFTFLGLPIIYAWAILWYLVMAILILTAYFKIWSKEK